MKESAKGSKLFLVDPDLPLDEPEASGDRMLSQQMTLTRASREVSMELP